MGVPHPVPALRGEIGGVVRSITGAPLRGICVTAAAAIAGRPDVASSVSESGGRYLITGLLPGRYKVSYQACGQRARYLRQWYGGAAMASDARQVAVRAGRPTVLGAVALRPATSAGLIAASRALARRADGADAARKPVIAGMTLSSKGKRLSGICVAATSETRSGSGVGIETGITTSSHGAYSFGPDDVSPGRWTVEFLPGCGNKGNFAPQWWKFTGSGAKAKVLVVGKHSHFTGIDARLVPGASISGTVRAGSASGPGLPGVCVLVEGVGPVSDVIGEAISGPGGKYRVADLGTGRYQLAFDPSCGAKGNFAPSSFPKDVAVTDGKATAGVNWFLPPGGEISGTVTTGAGHTPVRGICVEADSAAGGEGFGDAVSGADGGYTIKGLIAGKYEVSFTPGCGNSGSFAPVFYDNQVSGFAADTFAVAAGQVVTGIDASMPAGGTITGTVRDPAGRLLSGACVLVTSTADQAPSGSLEAIEGSGLGLGLAGFAITKGGQYKINDLLPGGYTVSFGTGCKSRTPSYAARWFAPQGGVRAAVLSVGAGITRGIDAKLSAPGTITGTVRAPGGKPAARVCVLVDGLSGEPSTILTDELGGSIPQTGKTGTYRITGLGPGQYQVEFQPCGGPDYAITWYSQAGSQASARAVTVRAGRTHAGVDEKMIVGTSISGRVTNASTRKPVAHRCVLAIDPDGNLAGAVIDKANGDYSIGNLAPASYEIEALPCLGGGGGLATQANPDVRLRRSESVKGVNFALAAAGSIAGEVTGGSPAGPLGGICVVASTRRGVAFGPAFTGSGGRYVLGGLAPGQYDVEFSSQCAGSTGGFVGESHVPSVTVASSAITGGVDAMLDADGGIAGTVQVSGKPAAGVCVLASLFGAGLPLLAVTNARGNFSLSGVTPSSYRVEFTAGCGVAKYRTQWFNGATSRAAATPVAVSAGTVSTGIDAH